MKVKEETPMKTHRSETRLKRKQRAVSERKALADNTMIGVTPSKHSDRTFVASRVGPAEAKDEKRGQGDPACLHHRGPIRPSCPVLVSPFTFTAKLNGR